MGIIFSSQYRINQTKLITTIYCYQCKKSFLYNDYYKHLYECNQLTIKKKNYK